MLFFSAGNWGPWGPYDPCSKTCGVGAYSRTRQCNNPTPQYGGQDCVQPQNQTTKCYLTKCPIGNQMFDLFWEKGQFGQVRLGQIRLDQVSSSIWRTGLRAASKSDHEMLLDQMSHCLLNLKVRLGQIKLGQVSLGQVSSGQVWLGQLR